MIKILKQLALIIVLSVTAKLSASTTYAPDFPNISVPSNLVFSFNQEFRGKEPLGFFYQHSDIQAKYLFGDYIDIFTDYRLIFQEKTVKAGFKDQSMFLEGFDLKSSDTQYGKISLRSRLEIGLNPYPTPTSYQLNEFPKYNLPWKFTKFQFNPFVADEMFFDCRNNLDFDKNRVYLGIDWQISKRIKCSTYYFRESVQPSSTKGRWTQADVIDQSITFVF